MIDLTKCESYPYKMYDGANGNKKCIIYQGEKYMVKFPVAKPKLEIHYTNSCVSEHIGSSIFRILGFSAQETFLATYGKEDKKKVVVACKDFCPTGSGLTLSSFAMLKNSCIESSSNGFGTELDSVISTMEEQALISENELKEYFWNMFVADAFLGNFDRHNGNWGFLTDGDGYTEIAPVYDCGSCLFPQASDTQLQKFLENPDEIKARVLLFPASALKIQNKKINYYDFLASGQNEDCTKALLRLAPVIQEKIPEICGFIANTEGISPIRKEFYQTILRERNQHLIQEPSHLLSKERRWSLDDLIQGAKDDCEKLKKEVSTSMSEQLIRRTP